ncbi:hypothetical protein F3Y22_tig00109972pilonHSYRG00122 [Hibiscus syriacus]|uniref:RNase H type-1 domain-containing protein n=1 Tax=Hibiscus syriacus TaxID=106335 RepID=A0A6A3BQE0_HIBSY|nr:hypothetical protein F3Y22_tig00109972pilonHSYRG00122 [Hibiscus syriacus]
MKLCDTLINSSDRLWVCLLRERYRIQAMVSDSLQKSNCSPFWRSISKVWPLYKSQLAWSIGNGSLISFWHDIWIPELGPVNAWKKSPLILADHACVKDFSLNDGSWNWVAIYNILHPQAAQFIYRSAASFGFRSATESFRMLTAANGASLMTESVFVAPWRRLPFTSSEIARWNLKITGCHPPLDTPWNILFAYALWHTWKSRNNLIFNGIRDHANSILHQRLHLAKHSTDWTTINIDSAVSSSGSAMTSGVFRDHLGNFLAGFNKHIGAAWILSAKLWGVYEGLKIAWSYGFEMVQNQVDSSDAYHLLKELIKREANMVADSLAKLENNTAGQLNLLESPPRQIEELLRCDISGPPYARREHA